MAGFQASLGAACQRVFSNVRGGTPSRTPTLLVAVTWQALVKAFHLVLEPSRDQHHEIVYPAFTRCFGLQGCPHAGHSRNGITMLKAFPRERNAPMDSSLDSWGREQSL